VLPCLLYEDEHLLVLNKPTGLNTHAPSPYAGEGIYDWLRHAEPRWSSLAIIQRLDKETSGVILFTKTPVANKALTAQFTARQVVKKYLLLTDREPPKIDISVKSTLARAGEKYVSAVNHPAGILAETNFHYLGKFRASNEAEFPSSVYQLLAVPLTGRTHQIRVHAAEQGLPILGDTLYGGQPWRRLCLHAAELQCAHPVSGKTLTFAAPADFQSDPPLQRRLSMIDLEQSNAFRMVHGSADAWSGWYLDRLGDYLLAQSDRTLSEDIKEKLSGLQSRTRTKAIYYKTLRRQLRGKTRDETSAQLVLGNAASERFVIMENRVKFEISFNEGYSHGLFLDQRENRRRLLTGHIAAGFCLLAEKPSISPASAIESPRLYGAGLEVLNTFAYTCGFSVCAALAGMRCTSLDLSKKYLEWGKQNFALNSLNPAEHDFIYGDVFDWLRRFTKKQRTFHVLILDPPTFSQSRDRGVFRAEKDYGKLVAAALPLVAPLGLILASTNAMDVSSETFLKQIESAVSEGKRRIVQRHYVPQPFDFPITREEPAYLKCLWMRLD
jgi:23S rRNA (cytosine1962-C5)-methyltransferase